MARLVPSTATRLGHQPRLRMRPTMAQSATPSSATVTATSASVSASMTVRRGLRPPSQSVARIAQATVTTTAFTALRNSRCW